jgi:hypothetical protein
MSASQKREYFGDEVFHSLLHLKRRGENLNCSNPGMSNIDEYADRAWEGL